MQHQTNETKSHATKRGVFPGSFNPPTIAHLVISQAAHHQHNLDEVVWSVSEITLEKESVIHPRLQDRIAVLKQVANSFAWLEISLTKAQLLSDIAADFDVIIMGADKWHQIHNIKFYDNDPAIRDASIAALPTVAVAPRPPYETPPELALDLAPEIAAISSTAARANTAAQSLAATQPSEQSNGDQSVMLSAAAEFDIQTGAWTDPDRYQRWLKNGDKYPKS